MYEMIFLRLLRAVFCIVGLLSLKCVECTCAVRIKLDEHFMVVRKIKVT